MFWGYSQEPIIRSLFVTSFALAAIAFTAAAFFQAILSKYYKRLPRRSYQEVGTVMVWPSIAPTKWGDPSSTE